MRRRSHPNYFNPNWKDGLTAAQINSRDSEGNPIDTGGQDRWNQAAAAQAQQMRVANGEIGGTFATLHDKLLQGSNDDLVATKHYQDQQDYQALAGALGVDVTPKKDVWDEATQRYTRQKAPPSFESLKGAYYSLPTNDQAKLYMAGNARFIDPTSGAKMLEGLQKTRETSMNEGINSMASQIARGEVTNDPTDGLFYRTITEKDPITGEAKKTKQKITPLEAKYIYEGRERGMLPDWTKLRTSDPQNDPLQDQPDPFGQAQVANSVATKRDPFVAAHDYLSSGDVGRDTTDLVGNVGTALADTATGVANGYTRARNAVARLMFGDTADQRPMVPKLSAQRPDDPMWLAAQAEQLRQEREQTPELDTALGGP